MHFDHQLYVCCFMQVFCMRIYNYDSMCSKQRKSCSALVAFDSLVLLSLCRQHKHDIWFKCKVSVIIICQTIKCVCPNCSFICNTHKTWLKSHSYYIVASHANEMARSSRHVQVASAFPVN